MTSERFSVDGHLGPIKVKVIDVEDGVADIEGQDPDGGEYAGALCLIRRSRTPIGLLEIPFDSGVITSDELGRLVDPLLAGDLVERPEVADDQLPFASVVIPSLLDRDQGFRDCLDSINELDYPSFEVLVVDNRVNGREDIPDWLVEHPKVRVVVERRPGISEARNRGIAEAKGEIIAFTDDDIVVDRFWLRAIATRFVNHPDEAGVMGMGLPRELETPAQLRFELYGGGWGRTYRPSTKRLLLPATGPRRVPRPTVVEFGDDGERLGTFPVYATSRFGGGANMAFRTESLRTIGGFDTALGTGTPTRGGEDTKVLVQLIWRGDSLGFEPASLVLHSHRRGDDELERQLRGWGIGFAAMIAALVADDVRHIAGIAMTIPTFVRNTLRAYGRRKRQGLPENADSDNTLAELARSELWGYLSGPYLYFQTRRSRRRLYGESTFEAQQGS